MNPGFLFLILHCQSRLKFIDCARFFALCHFVFLDHCSEDRRTFGGPDRNVAFRPCSVLLGMWSWKSPVFLSHPTRLNDSHLSPQISHLSFLLSPDYSWTAMDSWTIHPTGFDSDHLRSPLRANLEQGVKHRVETCMKANSFLAGADSRIPRIRE